MVQLKLKEMEKMVKKLEKVFSVKLRKTNHHYVDVYYDGKLIFTTKYSMGRGDIPGPVVRQIRKQFKFENEEELRNWRDCPLSPDAYLKLLRGRKVI